MSAALDRVVQVLFCGAMQHVLDKLTELPSTAGSDETDMIFLKGIMDNPIVRSLAKCSLLHDLRKKWLTKLLNSTHEVSNEGTDAVIDAASEQPAHIYHGISIVRVGPADDFKEPKKNTQVLAPLINRSGWNVFHLQTREDSGTSILRKF